MQTGAIRTARARGASPAPGGAMPACGATAACGGSEIDSSAEQFRRALGAEQGRHAYARRGGLARVDLRGRGDLHRAILRRDAPVEHFAPVSGIPFPAVRSHRRLTSAFERSKKASLGCDLTGARRVLERRQRIAGFPVVRADLASERALTRRRHDIQRIEPRRDLPLEVEPLESGGCEERRIEAVAPLLHLLRSEEHTSELQSQSNLVCRLLLEKKKKKYSKQHTHAT